ncbi:hypothetical protein C9374_010064 [Naegleria lovaniensis]|uniref:FAD/NAD(P)-binding domain-containing protein n=1 Tax=Naegleria lovaniensis TaxID=51637 RepID=A0AA88GCH4_NAELO|nr:uncharacterized protein C9374_010064 [Naegleria lovaniensis]KAG2375060.1 hypothetical protein C9374_010064 [Naegleria lovaniensis]
MSSGINDDDLQPLRTYMQNVLVMEQELSPYLFQTLLTLVSSSSNHDLSLLKAHDEGKFEKAMRWTILRGIQKPYSGVKLSEKKNASSWWFRTGTSFSHCFLVGEALDWMKGWVERMQKEIIHDTTSPYNHAANTSQLVEFMAQLMKAWGWIESLHDTNSQQETTFSFEKNKSQWFRMGDLAKPRLIVVGGGMSGYKVAKQLGDWFELTLIDKEGTMDLVPIYPTLITDKNNIHHIAIDHKKTLPSNVKCIKGVVTLASQVGVIVETLEAQEENGEVFKVDPKLEHSQEDSSTITNYQDLSLKDNAGISRVNDTIPHRYFMKFDYLVLAPGCTCWNNFPITKLSHNEIKFVNPYDANSLIESHSIIEQLSETEEICVLGGGYVAVEVAGFLAEKYRDKKITIIQRSHQLMKPSRDAHNAVMDIFKNTLTNVKVMLNSEIISQNGPKTFIVKTRISGEESNETQVNCSVCFICTGMRPQVGFLKDFFSASLDSNEFICVNSHMQVAVRDNTLTTSNSSYYDHIFAIGDATNVKETKLASHAHKHAKTAYTVLPQVAQSIPSSQLATYTPRGYDRPQTVIIGPNHGLWVKGSTLLLNSSVVAYFKERSQAMKGRWMAGGRAQQEENEGMEENVMRK